MAFILLVRSFFDNAQRQNIMQWSVRSQIFFYLKVLLRLLGHPDPYCVAMTRSISKFYVDYETLYLKYLVKKWASIRDTRHKMLHIFESIFFFWFLNVKVKVCFSIKALENSNLVHLELHITYLHCCTPGKEGNVQQLSMY